MSPGLPGLWGSAGPLCSYSERGGHGLATEVMGVFWLLTGNRNPANHILICSPQKLQRGSTPEPSQLGGSPSLACSFIHSLMHSFVQPMSSGPLVCQGVGPGAQP